MTRNRRGRDHALDESTEGTTGPESAVAGRPVRNANQNLNESIIVNVLTDPGRYRDVFGEVTSAWAKETALRNSKISK